MRYVADPEKERLNLAKHHLSLLDGVKVLQQPVELLWTHLDSRQREERWISFGPHPELPLVLMVVYHFRKDDEIRLISTRKATPAERKRYANRHR